jgi:hypothetical protein
MTALLRELLTGDKREANYCREHILEYNPAMVSATMCAKIKSTAGNVLYSFPIHGQIHHFVTPLYPKKANKPGYGQFYRSISILLMQQQNSLKTDQTKGASPK